jgi:hypothetical protein
MTIADGKLDIAQYSELSQILFNKKPYTNAKLDAKLLLRDSLGSSVPH